MTHKRLESIKSHTFRGKSYKIKVMSLPADRWGDCSPPGPGKEIRIKKPQAGRRLLQTIIDESLHAVNWDLDNDAVEEMQESISKFLWRAGYRNLDELNKKEEGPSN